MSDRKIRTGCIAMGLNQSLGRGCTDEEPCAQCGMQEDLERNEELYRAMATVSLTEDQ